MTAVPETPYVVSYSFGMERLAATLSLAVGLARHGAGNSRASTFVRLPPLQFGIAGSSSGCYPSCMITMTLKLPGTLLRVVEDEARRRGVAKSARSEEHTSELQSLRHLVCRLL